VTITPDTKDWTWVLRRPCPECGFDTQSFPRREVSALLVANAAGWRDVLAGRADDVRQRPRPDRWSPLEYACHVRDVCRLYAQRLDLMLTRDDPTFPNWDQDVTAVEDAYGSQDPAVVSGDLCTAALEIAAAFAAVPEQGWSRTGTRSDGAAFTVETFARYFIHDPIHHLYDVTGRRQPPAMPEV
jgi:hypothetical protein